MPDASIPIVLPAKLVEFPAERIRSHESFEGRINSGGDCVESTVESVEFTECRFESTNVSKSKWHKLRLDRVQLEKCDLANARWTNGMFEKTEFQKCRGTGWQLLDANCCDVLFVGGKLNLAAFHGSKFRTCRFESCDLYEANFEAVELHSVVFHKCDLRAARFPNCRFTNLDLRGSHLAGVQIDAAKLRGAKVELSQMPDLAQLFGLIVEPLDT